MITVILQELWPILLPISGISFALFFTGLYLILKYISPKKSSRKALSEVEKQTFDAIAGDDFIATQLDLACAFIEAGRGDEAKKILSRIAKHGSLEQQNEARLLLNRI